MKAPIAVIILVSFLVTGIIGPMPACAQDDFRLPAPGIMVHLSPLFDPPILKGIKVHPDNPFRFDFILDKGDSQLSNNDLKDESSKLIKYFLASLTIPEKDLWVNLSPYEKDRIIPNSFGLTEMGRDLLAEDYMLKQITASLIYPEGETGKKFWKRIYKEAAKRFGTTNIPVNTFNKVWIVPDKAVVYENAKAGTAYVVESKLKVMLEQDYLALEKNIVILSAAKDLKVSLDSSAVPRNDVSALGSQIVREIVIPELTKEVNEDKNFSKLRQVYNSLILAVWYKKKIKDSILSQVYADKNKTAGVQYTSTVIPAKAGIKFKNDIEGLYQEYLKAFKKGVYNYIKEEQDPLTQEIIPRKYFSGGFNMAMVSALHINTDPDMAKAALISEDHAMIVNAKFNLAGQLSKDLAQIQTNSSQIDEGEVDLRQEYYGALEKFGITDRLLSDARAGIVPGTEQFKEVIDILMDKMSHLLGQPEDIPITLENLRKYVKNEERRGPIEYLSDDFDREIESEKLTTAISWGILKNEDEWKFLVREGQAEALKEEKEKMVAARELMLKEANAPSERLNYATVIAAFLGEQAVVNGHGEYFNVYIPRDMGLGFTAEQTIHALAADGRGSGIFYVSRKSFGEKYYYWVSDKITEVAGRYHADTESFLKDLGNELFNFGEAPYGYEAALNELVTKLKQQGFQAHGKVRFIDSGLKTFPLMLQAIFEHEFPEVKTEGLVLARDQVVSSYLPQLNILTWRPEVRWIVEANPELDRFAKPSETIIEEADTYLLHPFRYDEQSRRMVPTSPSVQSISFWGQISFMAGVFNYEILSRHLVNELEQVMSEEQASLMVRNFVKDFLGIKGTIKNNTGVIKADFNRYPQFLDPGVFPSDMLLQASEGKIRGQFPQFRGFGGSVRTNLDALMDVKRKVEDGEAMDPKIRKARQMITDLVAQMTKKQRENFNPIDLINFVKELGSHPDLDSLERFIANKGPSRNLLRKILIGIMALGLLFTSSDNKFDPQIDDAPDQITNLNPLPSAGNQILKPKAQSPDIIVHEGFTTVRIAPQKYIYIFKSGGEPVMVDYSKPRFINNAPNKEHTDAASKEEIELAYKKILRMKVIEKQKNDHAMRTSDQAMTRRFFGKLTAAAVAGAVLKPRGAYGQSSDNDYRNSIKKEWERLYAGFYNKNANPVTGLSLSYPYLYPDQPSTSPNLQYGAYLYDSSLRILAEDWTGMTAQEILNSNAAKILLTYAANNSGDTPSANQPTTIENGTYVPTGGEFTDLRIENFGADWNAGWPFDVEGGPNAWMGNAAIQKYLFVKNSLSEKSLSESDRQLMESFTNTLLQFAQQRARFLIGLYDHQNGGIRYGPQNQSNANPLANWNIKSTENNESALAFFDNLIESTVMDKQGSISKNDLDKLFKSTGLSDNTVGQLLGRGYFKQISGNDDRLMIDEKIIDIGKESESADVIRVLDEILQMYGYVKIANGIYRWLMDEMYDMKNNIFSRGENYDQVNGWVKDGEMVFSPDTTNWAPVERMLDDPRLGKSREERLDRLGKMVRLTANLTGVRVDGKFKGISFSNAAHKNDIVSVEWSSQFTLLHWRIAQEYFKLIKDTNDELTKDRLFAQGSKYENAYKYLTGVIKTYFIEPPLISGESQGNYRIAPEAVYGKTGKVAGDVDTGQNYNTPPEDFYAAVASIYYIFALTKHDPRTGQKITDENPKHTNRAMISIKKFLQTGLLTMSFARVGVAITPQSLGFLNTQNQIQGVQIPGNLNALIEGQLNKLLRDYLEANQYRMTDFPILKQLVNGIPDIRQPSSNSYALLGRVVKNEFSHLEAGKYQNRLSAADQIRWAALQSEVIDFIQTFLMFNATGVSTQASVSRFILGDKGQHRMYSCDSVSAGTKIVANEWGLNVDYLEVKEDAKGQVFSTKEGESHVINGIQDVLGKWVFWDQRAKTVPRRVFVFDSKKNQMVVPVAGMDPARGQFSFASLEEIREQYELNMMVYTLHAIALRMKPNEFSADALNAVLEGKKLLKDIQLNSVKVKQRVPDAWSLAMTELVFNLNMTGIRTYDPDQLKRNVDILNDIIRRSQEYEVRFRSTFAMYPYTSMVLDGKTSVTASEQIIKIIEGYKDVAKARIPGQLLAIDLVPVSTAFVDAGKLLNEKRNEVAKERLAPLDRILAGLIVKYKGIVPEENIRKLEATRTTVFNDLLSIDIIPVNTVFQEAERLMIDKKFESAKEAFMLVDQKLAGLIVKYKGKVSEENITSLETTRNKIPSRIEKARNGDKAMLQKAVAGLIKVRMALGQKASAAMTAKGGIDLTPANMHLQTQNAGEGIKFHLDPAMLKRLQNAPGFTPVIINIQPMKNLEIFLGLAEEKSISNHS